MTADGVETIRTFIGIPLGGDAKAAFLRLQERFRLDIRDQHVMKWERAANMHATVQFLGTTPRAEVDAIEAALRRACTGHSPFELVLASPTAFGGRKPRVMVSPQARAARSSGPCRAK